MTSDPQPPRAGAPTFAGLFLVTLATLTYQLLLTRIFSVTMYYHFAFVAISVTMFGMAVGALMVYLRPRASPPTARPPAVASRAGVRRRPSSPAFSRTCGCRSGPSCRSRASPASS